MKREAIVEIFAKESNFAVIRAPGRKYPGVLIQGDSLAVLLDTAKEAIELFEKDREESLEALKYLYDQLNRRLEGYKKVLEENNSPFPF